MVEGVQQGPVQVGKIIANVQLLRIFKLSYCWCAAGWLRIPTLAARSTARPHLHRESQK